MVYEIDKLQSDVAQVQHPLAGFGSGRLIAKNLVLTAAHTLWTNSQTRSVMNEGWQVRLARDQVAQGSWPFRQGNSVIWYNDDSDMALIRLNVPLGCDVKPMLDVRIAEVKGNNSHIVEARGYPRASKAVDGPRTLTPVFGSLRAATRSQPLTFAVNTPDLPNLPRENWAGLSGSAVMLQDWPDSSTIWVYGIIKSVAANFDGQLQVTRLTEAWECAEVRKMLLAAGVPNLGSYDPTSIGTQRLTDEARKSLLESWRSGGLLSEWQYERLRSLLRLYKGSDAAELPQLTSIIALIDAVPSRLGVILDLLPLIYEGSPVTRSDVFHDDSRRLSLDASRSRKVNREKPNQTDISSQVELRRLSLSCPLLDRGKLTKMVVPKWETTKLSENFIPLRLERMTANPLAFFRGSLAVMAKDLSNAPSSGIMVQSSGDSSLSNFAIYQASDGYVAYDIIDFVETSSLPFEWDLKRLATSILLLGAANGEAIKNSELVVKKACKRYRKKIEELSKLSIGVSSVSRVDVWDEVMSIKDKDQRKDLIRRLNAAMKQASRNYDLTQQNGDISLVRSNTLRSAGNRFDDISRLFDEYYQELGTTRQNLLAHFYLRDFALKLVGIGSVGALNCVGLFATDQQYTLLLELRQARPSSYEQILGQKMFKNDADRIASGQRAIQLVPDPFLSSIKSNFVVKRLSDGRLLSTGGLSSLPQLTFSARLAAGVLACGHARSPDAISKISGYIGGREDFEDTIIEYACNYLTTVNEDWIKFRQEMFHSKNG